jgi:hypothetical protein
MPLSRAPAVVDADSIVGWWGEGIM